METTPVQQSRASSMPTGSRTSQDSLLIPSRQFDLLLAIENDDVADAAIHMTDALARKRGAVPSVIQALDPAPYGPPPFTLTMMSFAEALIGPEASAERRREVSARIERVCGRPMAWPVVSRLGNPTTCIIDEAHQRASELLVLGLHQHGRVDRLFGAETTIHVMANAGIPVLAVTSQLCDLPNSILVAVDFGHSSVHMATLAARLVEPTGRLILAHVQYPNPPAVTEDSEGAEVIHREGVAAAFAKLVRTIAPPTTATVETVVLEGDPASALVAYAERSNPNLIAAASQRHPFVNRLLLGSVSRTIVRDARWSVFVTPPADAQDRAHAVHSRTETTTH
jgi:nucleotide-binding universal stress UspA family protein